MKTSPLTFRKSSRILIGIAAVTAGATLLIGGITPVQAQQSSASITSGVTTPGKWDRAYTIHNNSSATLTLKSNSQPNNNWGTKPPEVINGGATGDFNVTPLSPFPTEFVLTYSTSLGDTVAFEYGPHTNIGTGTDYWAPSCYAEQGQCSTLEDTPTIFTYVEPLV